VRDLAWACFGPALVESRRIGAGEPGAADCAPILTGERRLWLEALDRDATALLQHLGHPLPRRLGIYFEKLWHFFLSTDPDTELVAHNLPVRDDGRTLGEFDCLYYCRRRDRHCHLELAAKYFLGIEGAESGARWLGPDGRDRLDLKLDHMLRRQLALGDRPQARKRLGELGIVDPLREIALRGRLFQPLTGDLALPPGHNPDNATGTWLRQRSVADFLERPVVAGYLPLHRLHWLSPAAANGREVLGADELRAGIARHFAAGGRPQMVAALDDAGMETSRFMVVPDNWPTPYGQRGG